MKKIYCGFLMLLAAAALFAADGQTLPVRRIGLFVGANDGGTERSTLLYASRDAENMSALMGDLGGIAANDNNLLLNPSRKDVEQAFRNIGSEIESRRSEANRLEFLFYYSGHSDETQILLGNDRLEYREIRSLLENTQADVTVAIIDSCFSGAFIRSKGGKKVPAFLQDQSVDVKGHAYLTSSSADEVSQESDTIKGSFFTYFLMTGLRGAADSTHDNRITLNEIYKHTYDETLRRTETTIGGAQRSAYELNLIGTGDLVLTDISEISSSLLVDDAVEGQLFVRNASGDLVAEMRKNGSIPLVLALPAGRYSVHLKDAAEDVHSAEVELVDGFQYMLASGDFTVETLEPTQYRGESPLDEIDDYAPMNLDFSMGLSMPDFDTVPAIEEILNNAEIGIVGWAPSIAFGQLNLVGGTVVGHTKGVQLAAVWNITKGSLRGGQASGVYNIVKGDTKGLQLSGIFNITANDMLGIQSSGVYNIVEDLQGAQIAGVFNVSRDIRGVQLAGVMNSADDVDGIQLAGIFSRAGDDMQGLQISGVFNTADDVDGLQGAGIFNTAQDGKNLQIGGIFNVAGSIRGLQLAGLFNRSREMDGVQGAGLFNIAQDVDGMQIAGLFNIGAAVSSGQIAGLFNRADSMDGLSIGIVNVAREMNGLSIGLFNISRNGIMEPSVWYDTKENLLVGFRSGNRKLYTSLYTGGNYDEIVEGINGMAGIPADWIFGAGLGLRGEFGAFTLDHDFGAKFITSLSNWQSYSIPVYKAILGVEVSDFFSMEGGVTLDVRNPLHVDRHFEGYTYEPVWSSPDKGWGIYPEFFWGIRI